MPTAIWSSLLGKEGGREEIKEGRKEVTLREARDPNLAGGEQVRITMHL